MGYNIYFKKGDTTICSFSRLTELFQAFDVIVTYEEWTELERKDLREAKDSLQDRIDFYVEEISRLEKVLEGLTNYEDRYAVVKDISDFKQSLQSCYETKPMIDMLMEILEQNDFETNQRVPLYGGIF